MKITDFYEDGAINKDASTVNVGPFVGVARLYDDDTGTDTGTNLVIVLPFSDREFAETGLKRFEVQGDPA